MKKYIKYTLIGLLLAFIVIQFVPKDERINEPVTSNDIMQQMEINASMSSLLQNACYDCHSNQPEYPWYAHIAPVSWKVKEHISDGRSELNFSEWGAFSAKKRDHKLEEMIEEVEAGEMPLKEYKWFHSEGRLTEEDISLLKDWANQERTNIQAEQASMEAEK